MGGKWGAIGGKGGNWGVMGGKWGAIGGGGGIWGGIYGGYLLLEGYLWGYFWPPPIGGAEGHRVGLQPWRESALDGGKVGLPHK